MLNDRAQILLKTLVEPFPGFHLVLVKELADYALLEPLPVRRTSPCTLPGTTRARPVRIRSRCCTTPRRGFTNSLEGLR